MQDNDPGGFAARNVRFFRSLAIAAGGVIVGSLIIALGTNSLDIQGYFDLSALTRALLLMAVGLAAILVLFLLRIGVIFDVERQVKDMFHAESERFDDLHRSQAEELREFRDSMRRDLADLREAMKKEFNQRDQMYDGAMRASNQALRAAQDALARAEALSKEPAYRTTIEQLVADVGDMKRDLTALRTADRVNSPLLKELQEKVVLLEAGQKKLNVRVDETMESVERRDMEQAALRQTLDHELAGLKKRETLLLVKQRELEDNNVQLSLKAKQVKPAFAPGEEEHHILTVAGIGPVYASRLNAAGIITVPQLIAADPQQVGARIDALPDLVKEWQAVAQVAKLKGISGPTAEALVKAGYASPKAIAAADPEELAARVKDVERARKAKAGVDVTPAAAQKWIEAARSAS
jgi:predicted flap endonuclease-1-like 5' DNA nuclease